MARNHFQETIQPLLEENTSNVIAFMKEKKLLAATMLCNACQTPMNWTKYNRYRDLFAWKCQNKECIKFKLTKSVRCGSFFENSRISLQSWIHAIYLWCQRISVKTASQMLNLSEKTVVDMYSFFRQVCSKYFEAHPIQLGGADTVVQIDESMFCHKPKHHRGRATKTEVWVFGLVDTSTTPGVGYMEIVSKRDSQTLLPIIQKVVRPGTTLHSDQWKAYLNISRDLGFRHQTVNHQENFVDPITGVHTQSIESYWNRQKNFIKSMRGVRRPLLKSYLDEFMWRERHSSNAFDFFCAHIAMQFNLN